MKSFKTKNEEIKRNFEEFEIFFNKSVYRKGVSAYRYGGLRGGISDHLPVSFNISPVGVSDNGEMVSPVKAVSWNLLSDDHLWNNFMNITGSKYISDKLSDKNIYKGRNIYHFFCEISQFLYEKSSKFQNDSVGVNRIFEIDDEIGGYIMEFGDPDKTISLQSSPLTRSRDELKVASNIDLVKKSRQELIDIFCKNKDGELDLDAEFELAIKHSMEMVYHILNDKGSLKWSNRYELLANDKGLLSDLKSHDVICLQECNDPQQILDLLNESGDSDSDSDKYSMIYHSVRGGSKDNCVIIYNKNRFDENQNSKFALSNGKKPAIVASFEDKENQSKLCVIGSIHHPGGGHYEMDAVQDKALEIVGGSLKTPIMILGDHNNTQEMFLRRKQGASSVLFDTNGADSGTMAGVDHGLPRNSSIDLCSHINCDISSSRVIEQNIRGGYSDQPLLRPVEEQRVSVNMANQVLGAFYGAKTNNSSQSSEMENRK